MNLSFVLNRRCLLSVPRNIIFFSTANWDDHFWTNNQHIASRLAQRGFRLLYVESLGLRRPTLRRTDLARILHRLVRALVPLRRPSKNIWVYSPLIIPFHRLGLCRWINDKSLLFFVSLFTRLLGMHQSIIWTYNPLMSTLIDSIPKSLVVYHCVDDLAAVPNMPIQAIRSAQQTLLAKADLVFTTSYQLRSICSEFSPRKTYYFPNVADFEHFSAARSPGPLPQELQAIPTPRIGFIGAVSNYKVDCQLISTIAKARPDWHWVMIGQVGQGQPSSSVAQLRLPNIHLLGPRSYDLLPDYLRGIEVAVLPCPLNDYTRSMFPLKFFEYLSAGKPVVATRLDALKDYSDVCQLCDSPAQFIQALNRVLSGHMPERNKTLELAQQHTWNTRLSQMLNLIAEKHQSKNASD